MLKKYTGSKKVHHRRLKDKEKEFHGKKEGLWESTEKNKTRSAELLLEEAKWVRLKGADQYEQ